MRDPWCPVVCAQRYACALLTQNLHIQDLESSSHRAEESRSSLCLLLHCTACCRKAAWVSQHTSIFVSFDLAAAACDA